MEAEKSVSTCNVIIFFKHIQILFQAENSMKGGAHMGELLIQIWLKSTKNE